MKTGRTISQLAAELERQANTKRDYIADYRALHMSPADGDDGKGAVILEGVNGGMPLAPIAHQQLANTLAIPRPYYDRMLAEAPDLLSFNVNKWLGREKGKRMVRTLDGRVRAILSDQYRPLDNLELAEAVLPRLVDLGAEVVSSEVTDSRFYLKATTARIRAEVKVGDAIQAGLVVANSEVGHGSLQVSAMDYRLVCLNGMIRESEIRKTHVGRGSRRMDALEEAREYFRDSTRRLDDAAFFAKVQDATAALMDESRFRARIAEYSSAADRPIEGDPVAVVEVTAKRLELGEKEKRSVLTHLIQGGSLSQWGLANAVTRMSQDVDSYDRATELEAAGAKIIELAPADWRKIAATAAL